MLAESFSVLKILAKVRILLKNRHFYLPPQDLHRRAVLLQQRCDLRHGAVAAEVLGELARGVLWLCRRRERDAEGPQVTGHRAASLA